MVRGATLGVAGRMPVGRGAGPAVLALWSSWGSWGSWDPAAVHAGVLDALGHPPAEHGRGQQPRGDRADERLMRPHPQREGADRHRPHQDPGDRTARHEPAGQRPGVRGQRDRDGQQQHGVKPGPVAAVRGGEYGHAPDRHRGGGNDGAPSLDHRDDRVDQRGQDDQAQRDREEQDSGGDHDDLQPGRGPPVCAPEPDAPARLVLHRGLGPIVWQHHASSPLCPCLPRACLGATPRGRRVGRLAHDPRIRLPDSRMSCIAHDPGARQHTRRYCR